MEKKYVLTRAMFGAEGLTPVGTEVELTDAQAMSPLWRFRVRPMDAPVTIGTLVAALAEAKEDVSEAVGEGVAKSSAADQGGFDWELYREGFIEELNDQGIEFDADAPAESLAAMLDEQVREAVVLAAQ